MPRQSPPKAPRQSAALEAVRRRHYLSLAVLDKATAARRTAYAENPGLYLCPQVEAILADIKRAVKALETY